MGTLLYTLSACLLGLLCTRTLKSLGQSFSFVFGAESHSMTQARQCLHALRVAVATPLLFGVLRVITVVLNEFRSMDSVSTMGASSLAALLSLFYPVLIALVLLPVYSAIKRFMSAS